MNQSFFLNFHNFFNMKDRASILTEIIYKNPGLHFCEMIRVSGMKNGVLSHYLNKLESTGIINIQREKKKTRFFSPKISDDEVKIIRFLRKETSRKIILSIINREMEFSEITKKVSKSAPTISQNLSELIKNNLVIVKLENSQKKYFIKNNILLKKIIKKYHFD